MNTRAKGNTFQVWIRRFLVERGWTVRNFPLTIQPLNRGGKTIFRPLKQDAWAADLIARRPGTLLWIQASCSGGIAKRVEEFKAADKSEWMIPLAIGAGVIILALSRK
jgi:hypothetical protein